MKDFIEHINTKEPDLQCLIDNNEKQIDEIQNFLQGDKKLFLLNGFLGSGKTSLLNFIIKNLQPDVLTIKYTCFETTVLDDMLLSFFECFRNFTIEGKIISPKIKAENFNKKINSYFNSITKPILIVLDAYDSILKENKPEILSFISHISKLSNIKIIISARAFNYEDFEGSDYSQSTVLAFTKEIFEKFLKQNDIKNIGVLSNELYKQTKGYYHYINLSVKIMKLRAYNLGKFLEVYSKNSSLGFSEFILRDIVSMIDPVSLHLFRLLAIMRIPIHINLLKSLHLFNDQQSEFYFRNTLLASDSECVYLPDYYRVIIERQIQDTVMIKLHKACVELYETQLPLKPLERDLRLSRQTMRNEIDYHSLFIPQKPVINTDITPQEVFITPQPVNQIENEETKEQQIEKINFIIDDEEILNNIATSIEEFVNDKTIRKELIDKSTTLNLTQLLNAAHQQENKYDYKNAAILYQTALTKKNDDNFDTFLPTIYLKLANVYNNMSRRYEALEYFTKAQDYYYNVNDNQKVSEIKLEIAKIYFAIYKYDNAKYILEELSKNSELSNELHIKVNLLLGKLTNNIDEEYEYYKKSLQFVDNTIDKGIISELYYRYAEVNDEKNDPKTAVTYYIKCIETEQNSQNHYLSRAYANIAELCDDNGNTPQAIKYYEKSIEIDELTKNYNGLYSNSRNLADIYASKDEKKSFEYLQDALKYAKQLNEPFYKADTAMEIGNFYLLRGDYQNAYEYFVEAEKVTQHSFSKDNLENIRTKIDYVKKLAGIE